MTIAPGARSQLFQVYRGGIFKKRPLDWVEVDPEAGILRRVYREKVSLELPLARVQSLFILELGVFRSSSNVVTDGSTRYELYVEGALDLDRLVVDMLSGAIEYEYAIARGALATHGGLEPLRAAGREIAAAAGAVLEESVRTLPPVVPIPAEPTEWEVSLRPALERGWADAKLKAAVARELGRIGSRHIVPTLRSMANHHDVAIREAVRTALERIERRSTSAS